MSEMKDMLTLTDLDGIQLRVGEVFGFGEPMLALFVIDEHEEGINLTLKDAAKLLERLKRFTTRTDS